jgi:cytochrome c peroxidase
MGLTGSEDRVMADLRAAPRYGPLFAAAFPGEADPFTWGNVIKAVASFERTLLSGASRYDQFVHGGRQDALTEAEQRGMDHYFSERFECFHCHGGFVLADSVTFEGMQFIEPIFHNNGLYNVGGTGAYPPGGEGLFEATGLPSDQGRMKAPSLRNIALTAPYMHDGSLFSLEDVVDFYAAGGRNIPSGPYAGDGRTNPNKDSLVRPFSATPQERADLVAFLGALTDVQFVTDPRHGNPWLEPPPDLPPDSAEVPDTPDVPDVPDAVEVADPGPGVPTWQDRIGPLMQSACVPCHDSKKTGAARLGAPVGHDFDTYEKTKKMALQANDVIQIGKMPPAGPLPAADKADFHAWVFGGMPD